MRSLVNQVILLIRSFSGTKSCLEKVVHEFGNLDLNWVN